MPILLERREFTDDIEGCTSVLIVSCPVCPAMSLALETETPLLEFFKHGIKTEAFEELVASIRNELAERGVRTDTFVSRVPTPLMCVWTEGQRERLREHAKGFDAAVIMGCSSAMHTAEHALKETGCKVIAGMRMKGIANATMKIHPSLTVTVEKNPVPDRHHVPPCDQPCEQDLEASRYSKKAAH